MESIILEKLCHGLWYLGIEDCDMRAFFRVSYSHTGVVYDTYLMDAGERYILYGTPPVKYIQKWMEKLETIIDIEKIGWIVVFGGESDRIALNVLMDKTPNITVVAGTCPMFRLDGFIKTDFSRIEIRNDRNLLLGNRSLNFRIMQDKYETPSLYIIEKEQGILITADAFGSFCTPGTAKVSEMERKDLFCHGARQYYSDIYGKDREKLLAEITKLVRTEGIRLICPCYGPAIDDELEPLLEIYEKRSSVDQERPVLAIISANNGFVRELADEIETGAREPGAIEVKRLNLDEMSRDMILAQIEGADAYLFGSSDCKGDMAKGIWDIATSINTKSVEGKIAAVFGNGPIDGLFAGGLKQRLGWLGFQLNTADFYAQGKPDEQDMKNAYEYGFDMSCILQRIPNPRKPKLVKCLVCGEIFDASLGICPVCGVGLEQCVPVDDSIVAFHKDTDLRYVIVGGGAAAVSAAEAIRQRDKTGTILMISAEPHLPINRPMLTKGSPEEILIHDLSWYEALHIEVQLGCSAESLDIEGKMIHTQDGQNISYDRLIYAAGAECFVPPFPGKDKTEVITIRHLEDTKKLGKLLLTAKDAVIIGGGVLGLEVASELMKAGIHVTVLEAAPQIVGRQIDSESAAILKKVMERMGVKCFEGISIEEIQGEDHVTGVRIADGTVIPADFVVVSCGNQGNIQLAQKAGIKAERSIVVNHRMETSVKGIFACGDCAQLDGVNYQLWQEACEQGNVAGANAAGDPVFYENQVFGLSLDGFGTSLFAIGDSGKNGNIPYRTVETMDFVAKRREKYWFYGESLSGAVLIGCPNKVAAVSRQVMTHARHSEIFG